MSMESFYGGRQGASFIIVKRFDGINILDKTEYKSIYYAVNSDGKFLYDDTDPDNTKWHFIEKTGNNFPDYTWSVVELNGDPLDAISLNTGTDTSIVTDIVYQEGMVQCFSQGGDSVDIVNYGEYVIIDTISKDDPDNGKVYRRGMNFDYDPETNPLAGAEYIGQIVGPRGETVDFDLELYENIPDPSRRGDYNLYNRGLLPGVYNGTYYKWVNGSDVYYTYSPQPQYNDVIYTDTASTESEYRVVEYDSDNNRIIFNKDNIVAIRDASGDVENLLQYNDRILYRWATIRDKFGTVSNYKIGFKVPYLIPRMSGRWREPYYTQEDYDLGRIDDPSLIGTAIHDADDFDLFIDNELNTADRNPNHGDTGHPYYRKWKISIPKGIKGDTISEQKIYPTLVIKGGTLYTEVDDEGHLSGNTHEAANNVPIEIESYYDTFEKGYVICKEGGNTYYAYLEDTVDLHYGYLFTWYDENKDGSDHRWVDIGAYKNIDKIHLSRSGILTVTYTSGHKDGKDVENIDEQITWPTQVSLTQAGVLKFLYNNNLLDDIYPPDVPVDGTVDRINGSYSFILPWINKVNLSSTGEFKIFFNNDKNKAAVIADGGIWDDDDHAYVKNIAWVKDIKIDEDGTMTLIWCDDTLDNPHRTVYNFKMKKIDNVWIETEKPDGAGEGTGDQKIHLEFNTKVPDPEDPTRMIKETKIIGKPINYVVETIVSQKENEWSVPENHLLVWYSDPVYRTKLKIDFPDKVYTYKGIKDTTAKDGWFDLGYVKGGYGGIHIIGNVEAEEDLYNDGATKRDPKKPEDIGGPGCEGWVMTVHDPDDTGIDPVIYAYDYTSTPNKWYPIGSLNGDQIDPRKVIVASNINTPPTTLNTHGFWLVTEPRKYAL